MSDWGATHSTSINAGLDVEMPAAAHMNGSTVAALVKSGKVSKAKVVDSVVRILTPMFAVGVMDEPVSAWDWKKLKNNATSEASVASARKLSAASTVLLKNVGGVLPLPSGGRIAVLG